MSSAYGVDGEYPLIPSKDKAAVALAKKLLPKVVGFDCSTRDISDIESVVHEAYTWGGLKPTRKVPEWLSTTAAHFEMKGTHESFGYIGIFRPSLAEAFWLIINRSKITTKQLDEANTIYMTTVPICDGNFKKCSIVDGELEAIMATTLVWIV